MHKTHRTHPWVTMLAPAAVNIPLLIAASFGVRNALLASPEIATSSSLWLQSLGDPDSTAILPIATAILAYGNIELIQRSQRIRKKLHKLADVAPKEKLDQVEKLEPMPDAPDHLKPRPGPTPEAASDHMLELGPAKENLGQSGQLRPGIARARASSRLEKPRSQIVDETRLKPGSPPFRPLEPPKPVPKGERRKPRAPPKLENVSKVNRVLEFALSDRDRMSKGFGNFMSVVAICIVPAGMMTPAVSPPTNFLPFQPFLSRQPKLTPAARRVVLVRVHVLHGAPDCRIHTHRQEEVRRDQELAGDRCPEESPGQAQTAGRARRSTCSSSRKRFSGASSQAMSSVPTFYTILGGRRSGTEALNPSVFNLHMHHSYHRNRSAGSGHPLTSHALEQPLEAGSAAKAEAMYQRRSSVVSRPPSSEPIAE